MSDVSPQRCSTGDPDNGGNCRACDDYRRLRALEREKRLGER